MRNTGICLAGLLAAAAGAADWPHWRGPSYNGISTETGWRAQWPAQGPRQLWKASVGTGFSSTAVAQGRIYAMGNKEERDSVICFEEESGKELWRHSYACPLGAKEFEGGPTSTPTVEGGKVYTLSRRGHLFCLDVASGAVVWSNNVAAATAVKFPYWGFSSSVLVDKNLLIMNVGTAGTAVDKGSGKVVWCSGKDMAGYSSPVPCEREGKRAAGLLTKAEALAVEIQTGQVLWRHPWKAPYGINVVDLVLAGDEVFISSGYGLGAALLKLEAGQANVVWQNDKMRNHFNSCVLADGYLYGPDGYVGSAGLNCIAWKTGELKWREPAMGAGGLMLADKKLIILSEKGELVIAESSPEAFKPISRAPVLKGKCWTPPVLANGRVYCRSGAGDLVCLDVKGKSP